MDELNERPNCLRVCWPIADSSRQGASTEFFLSFIGAANGRPQTAKTPGTGWKGTARPSSISRARSKAACFPGRERSRFPSRKREAEALTLDAARASRLLLEAMPAAIGILGSDGLIYANTAFAFAFGYRSPSELLEAGGLDAILPNGAPLTQDNGAERSAPIEALTRSRRKLKVAFALTALDGDVKLLRLIDQTSLERRDAARLAGEWREPRDAHASRSPKLEADASARLDFLAKVSHEVRTPLNSIIGFTELMAAGALRTDRQRALQGLCRGHPSERALCAVAAQRPARHLQDRGRQVRAQFHRGRSAGAGRGLRRQPAAARQARAHRAQDFAAARAADASSPIRAG